MAFNWNTSSPADDGVISQFPADERAFRAASRGAFNVDHDADGTGYHTKVTMSDPGSEPTFASLMLGLYQRAGVLKSKLASGTAKQIPQFTTGSSGDTVLFVQAAAPTGWTQNTAVNDKVLRIVSGTGAGTGGTWTLAGLTMPHTHTQQGTFGTGGPSGTQVVRHVEATTSAASSGHGHNVTISGQTGAASTSTVVSDGTWRPAYQDVIACYMTT